MCVADILDLEKVQGRSCNRACRSRIPKRLGEREIGIRERLDRETFSFRMRVLPSLRTTREKNSRDWIVQVTLTSSSSCFFSSFHSLKSRDEQFTSSPPRNRMRLGGHPPPPIHTSQKDYNYQHLLSHLFCFRWSSTFILSLPHIWSSDRSEKKREIRERDLREFKG